MVLEVFSALCIFSSCRYVAEKPFFFFSEVSFLSTWFSFIIFVLILQNLEACFEGT